MPSEYLYRSVFDTVIYLKNTYNIPLSDARDIVSFAMEINYSDLTYYHNQSFLPKKDFSGIEKMLSNEVPTAYITGRKEFYGLEFKVNEHVLIPRPESEVLVTEVLNRISFQRGKIIDLGTGSGCILISLLHNLPFFSGTGLDVSFDALRPAAENAEIVGVSNRCDFVCGDMLDSDKLFSSPFDVVISNPPYVSYDDHFEKSLFYEPEAALFAQDKGLYFYKNLLSKLDKLCNKGGVVMLEIGSSQKSELEQIYIDKQVEFIKDYAGNYRIMFWKN